MNTSIREVARLKRERLQASGTKKGNITRKLISIGNQLCDDHDNDSDKKCRGCTLIDSLWP